MSVVILNFHGLGPALRRIDDGEHSRWLEADIFEEVLDIVRQNPRVRLTFDDGNESDVGIALPALRRRGMTATFFVCSGRLGQPTFLSKAQVRELQSHGMRIGSHGVAHVAWRHLAPERLREELQGSRATLEEVCGVPIDTAACPFGEYDRTVLRGLRVGGYRAVYTSDGGTASENGWLQARTSITRFMAPDDIRRLISHGIGVARQLSISAQTLGKCLRS